MAKKPARTIRPLPAPVGWPAVAVLLLAAVLPYVNSLWGSFHFDDDTVIVRNQSIRSLGGVASARPANRLLAFLTCFVNYRLHGLGWMPGWHAVNIALHAGCVLALYAVLRRLPPKGGQAPHALEQAARARAALGAGSAGRVPARLPTFFQSVPFYAALLFAVHPLASEPVNYIQARNVLLYTLFSLLGLLAAASAHRAGSWLGRLGLIALMTAAWVCAALSKEVGLVFAPAVAGLYAAVFILPQLARRGRLWLAVTLGAVAVLIALGGVWLRASGAWKDILARLNPAGAPEEASAFFWSHLWAQATVFWKYVYLALVPLPAGLTVDHYVATYSFDPQRQDPPYSLMSQNVLLSVVALAGLLGLALWQWRRRPQLSFCLLLPLLGLAPYFLMTSVEMMVEYRFYLPLAGFCALAGWGLIYLTSRWGRRFGWGTVAALCAALAACTLVRNAAWRTNVSLWEDAVAKEPYKARTVNGLAWALATDPTAPDPRRALELALKSVCNIRDTHAAVASSGDRGLQELFDRIYKSSRHMDFWPGYNPAMMDTLAEAFYVNGMHDLAVRVEAQVLEFQERTGQVALTPFFQDQYRKYVAARDARRQAGASQPASAPAPATATAAGP